MALERCVAEPITIYFGPPAAYMADAAAKASWTEGDISKCRLALKSNMDRIERICVEAKTDVYVALTRIFNPFPLYLRDLSFKMLPRLESGMCLVQLARSNMVPLALQHLTMDGITIPFHHATYENTIDLKLHNQLLPEANTFSLAEVLENCHRLTILDLRFAGPTLPPGAEEYPVPTR